MPKHMKHKYEYVIGKYKPFIIHKEYWTDLKVEAIQERNIIFSANETVVQ